MNMCNTKKWVYSIKETNIFEKNITYLKASTSLNEIMQ